MSKRKPWRKFKEKGPKDRHIRRICLIALAAEAAVMERRGQIHVPAVKVTENREVIIYQLPLEETQKDAGGEPLEIPSKDRIYGIRIRLKEGTVDFYRREELHDGGQ